MNNQELTVVSRNGTVNWVPNMKQQSVREKILDVLVNFDDPLAIDELAALACGTKKIVSTHLSKLYTSPANKEIRILEKIQEIGERRSKFQLIPYARKIPVPELNKLLSKNIDRFTMIAAKTYHQSIIEKDRNDQMARNKELPNNLVFKIPEGVKIPDKITVTFVITREGK